GGAVLGSWSPGRTTEVEVSQPSGTTTFRRAHVLDYGCLPGAEDDLHALIAARRATLAAEGLTHLSLLACDASSHMSWLPEAASHRDRFAMVMNPHGQSPADIAERGLYFDHLYF
ncbi:MAG: hypothetical protein LC792_19795, partial [Actinobacteria bacterium]|nr:hypothetical protein [Actinomycetota bacterium]